MDANDVLEDLKQHIGQVKQTLQACLGLLQENGLVTEELEASLTDALAGLPVLEERLAQNFEWKEKWAQEYENRENWKRLFGEAFSEITFLTGDTTVAQYHKNKKAGKYDKTSEMNRQKE